MMLLQLTRKQMAKLLVSLKGDYSSPLQVLKEAIDLNIDEKNLPPFLKKFERKRKVNEIGLSTNEIVLLANLCELTFLKSTSVQNWIKRDVKELIGPPELGKKYSIEQVAILLIVRDLKAVFDFETIRKILTVVFNTLSDRSDDLISPIIFYETYSSVLEEMDPVGDFSIYGQTLEEQVMLTIDRFQHRFCALQTCEWIEIKYILTITVLAVLSSHIQRKAQQLFQINYNERG
ncbi:DUF1836 domain-containing protein [Metabacillus fastidiosus]|uniref:DUF1836 domain-containing protein n=1 Tax=Metabacillus fastidiosus TaxID=1458 RepID=UPI002E21950F|nr:DUF1836 domain-containing protein [Metabacillus fastidiosus]